MQTEPTSHAPTYVNSNLHQRNRYFWRAHGPAPSRRPTFGERVLQVLLDQITPVPNPLTCDEEWQRREHLDLAFMTVAELRLERRRVDLRLLLDRAPDAWLFERLDRVDARIAAARHAG